jgi:RNA polymerase sigma-70 factor (ECF subfamily)
MTSLSDDNTLLTAFIDGDLLAGRRFFERYRSYIEACVRRTYKEAGFRASTEDVADTASEIWLTLLRDGKRVLRSYDPGRGHRLATWVGVISRNRTIDRIRTSHETPAGLATGDEIPSGEPLPGSRIEQQERKRLLDRAIAGLKEHDHRFLEALLRDEQSPEELARDLGISVASVYSRRCKLQKRLAKRVRQFSRPGRGLPAARESSTPGE